jgi:hypothetical protein
MPRTIAPPTRWPEHPGGVIAGLPASLAPEVYERLVGSPAFKAGGTGDPRPAGSIPVHLRQPP